MGGGCGTGEVDSESLSCRTADALCLQFKEQIVKGYCIPSYDKIRDLVGVAVHNLNGDYVGPEETAKMARGVLGHAFDLGMNNLLPRRIARGIELCFFCERGEEPSIRYYLCCDDFYNGWRGGIGNVYQFIDRAEAEARVNAFFTYDEMEMFGVLGNLMRYPLTK